MLVHKESLYRHSSIIAGAFPNISVITKGDGVLCRLDELPWNDAGGWQKPRPAA